MLAKQRQHRLDDAGAEGWRGGASEDDDFDGDDYEDYHEDGGGYSVSGRKGSRSSVAVTPGKRPVNNRHGGAGVRRIMGHSRRKRG